MFGPQTTSMQTSLLARLRKATHPLHEALDRGLVIGRESPREADYQAYFAAMLGLAEPLDAALWAQANWPAQLEAAKRMHKAAWLVEDLGRLGLQPSALAEIPRCAALPQLTSHGARLGAAYVLEGSTLGGRVIAKRPGGSKWRFFAGYGEETGPLWRTFCAELERCSQDPKASAAAVESARATFEAFAAWFARCGVMAPRSV